MRWISCALAGLSLLTGPSLCHASDSPKKITIAVLDAGHGNDHDERVLKLLKSRLENCSRCQIRHYPIYDSHGNLKLELFRSQLNKAAKNNQILHLSWNLPLNKKTKPLVQVLQEVMKSHKDVHLVAAAGNVSSKKTLIHPLKTTVLGQLSRVYLIGELNDKGHLAARSSYGPKLLTALRAPDGHSGSSFSAVLFTARLAKALAGGASPSYLMILKNKTQSTQAYPSLKELLPIRSQN